MMVEGSQNWLPFATTARAHHVFSIYNKLFSHLDAAEKKLKRKCVPWKKRMLRALREEKLSKYYHATDKESYGIVYAIATIFVPQRSFATLIVRTGEEKMRMEDLLIYALQKEFNRYQQRVAPQAAPANIQASQVPIENELELMMDSQTSLQAEVDQPEDEIMRYLAKGLTNGHPRLFWKEHEHEYPVLAKIVRDILSTPASGAGVERLFSCARDVCHYCRGQLKPDTIKGLMLHLFSSKFELEQSELDMIKEHLSSGEASMLDQTWKPVPSLNEVEPISDDEEGGCEGDDLSDDLNSSDNDHLEEELTLAQITTQRKQARRKRPWNKTSEPQNDGDNGLPLPEMATEESTQAQSGRIRKKPKLPDGYEIDKL